MRVRSPSGEDPLEESITTHSSVLAWGIPWTEKPGGLPSAAAATKSLQSCLTPCDPMDCSLPGCSIHGIFQARVLEWGAIAFSILSIQVTTEHRVGFPMQLLVVYFIHVSIGCTPQSQSPSHHKPPFPLGIHIFVLYVCVSISALQIRSSIPFFQIPHISINV